ncbi:hypothetical protein PINS_up002162 [Pythium insidiosum]|nr:hypothetical protein PINS_up002162 [Pythium insidiosum]
MFETLVTGVLTNVLGSYIDPRCFSPDKINVEVWSGYVVLRDLELKPEALASQAAVQLVRGVVGSIELKIPWNRLQSESVVLTIDDVYLLARVEADVEGVLREMDEFVIKKQLLEQLYSDAQRREAADSESAASSKTDNGFTARLVNKIIDNIELHIRRVHLRLEDHTTGDHPFAVGLTIESAHAQSTNSNWQPTYVDNTKTNEPRIYKIIELNHLSLYLDPHCDVLRNQKLDFATCSVEEFCSAFNHSIPKRFDDRHFQLYPKHQRHHFILKPVDASARLIVNRDPFDTSIPKFEVDVSIAEVALRLEESQYCDLLYLTSTFQLPDHYKRFQRYRKFRPRQSVLDSSPREWWRYAITAIVEDVKTKRRSWSWKYMKQRRDDKRRYIQLWIRHTRRIEMGPNPAGVFSDSDGEEDSGSIPGSASATHDARIQRVTQRELADQKDYMADLNALEVIERKRSVEDILFFRYLADRKMEAEDAISNVQDHSGPPMPPFSDSDSVDTETTESSMPTELRYRSWGKWMFGWTSKLGAAPSPIEADATPKRAFPEVELRELFKIVEYEPAKKAKKHSHNKHSRGNRLDLDDINDEADVVSRITFALTKGSITLCSDVEMNKKLKRDDPSYGSKYAPRDFLLGTFSNLQVAAITKGESTKVDVSLQSIEAFDESADSMAFSRLLSRKQVRPIASGESDGLVSANRVGGPVFLMSYETNPIGATVDAVLFVHMEPLEIVFSPTARCWGRLGTFLNTPQVLGLWAELEVASLNDIVNLKARTEAKLQYVMANRVSLSVDLRVQAPVIIIPGSDTDVNCSRMVIDLGHISFRTERLSRLDKNSAVGLASSTASIGNGPLSSSMVLSNPLRSPPLSSSVSFVKQLYDEAEKGEGAIRWKEEFYDKFALAITNVHVLLIPYGKPANAGQPSGDGSRSQLYDQDWELVERFNISVTVRTSVLPLDATLTRLYIHADLPGLTFNISLEKYFLLLGLVERFNKQEENQELRQRRESDQHHTLDSQFLDDEGRFVPERRRSFLSTSALKKIIEEDIKEPLMNQDQIEARSESDGLSDADSDDTWFSITSGNLDQSMNIEVAQRLEDLESFSLDGSRALIPPPEYSTPSPSKPAPKKRTRLPSTAKVTELLDRRLMVCTFTIPAITIQLRKPESSTSMLPPASYQYDASSYEDDDIPDSGTILIRLEGFRFRAAKRTLSTQVDVYLRSLDVEDYIEATGRTSEYLVFSSPSISAPFNLRTPTRRGPSFGAAQRRRRFSRQRERVISFQRADSAASGNLLELFFASTSDQRTGCEERRDLDVRFGAIHFVFDQSYVCSLLELLEETRTKLALVPLQATTDDDVDEEFKDAIPPPLELTPSVSHEYVLPVSLTESVLADLERAREELLAQNSASLGEKESDPTKDIMFGLMVQVQSVSICFCDRGEAVCSVAIIGSKCVVDNADSNNIRIRSTVSDIRVFDLSPDDSSGFKASTVDDYVELFGINHSSHWKYRGGDSLITADVLLPREHISATPSNLRMKNPEVSLSIQPARLLVSCRFVENVVGYALHGPIAVRMLRARHHEKTVTRCRRKRSESLNMDSRGVSGTHSSPRTPLSSSADEESLTPFFDAVDDPMKKARAKVKANDENAPIKNTDSTSDEPAEAPESIWQKLSVSVELHHPQIVLPCGTKNSKSTEVVVVDMGVILCKSNTHGEESTMGGSGYQVDVQGASIFAEGDFVSILDEMNVHIEVRIDQHANPEDPTPTNIAVALSTVSINISERSMCLALDIWSDVIQPLQHIASRATVTPLQADMDSVLGSTAADGDEYLLTDSENASSSRHLETKSSIIKLSLEVESFRFALVSRSSNELEGWLRQLSDTQDTSRESAHGYSAPATPMSPRRRRHLHSFAESVVSRASDGREWSTVAEWSFSKINAEVEHCKDPRDISTKVVLDIAAITIRDTAPDDSEYIQEVLCPARPSKLNAEAEWVPQVSITLSRSYPTNCSELTDIVTGSLRISSLHLHVAPRALLRIEHHVIAIAISFVKKMAELDPHTRTVDGKSSLGFLSSRGAKGSTELRVRKGSLAESIQDDSKSMHGIDEVKSTSTLQRRVELTMKAELADVKLWLLTSEKKRDIVGVYVSSAILMDIHGVMLDKELQLLNGKVEVTDVQAGTGAFMDCSSSNTPPEMTHQASIVKSFNIDASAQAVRRRSAEEHDSQLLAGVSDATREHIPKSWDAWTETFVSARMSPVMIRTSFQDMPTLIKIAQVVTCLELTERSVRAPYESLNATALDPFADLASLEIDDDFDSVSIANDIDVTPHSVVAVDIHSGPITVEVLNNLVGEDSPVIGSRVGPLAIQAHNIGHLETSIVCSCSLEAWYHNLRLVALEPLIEPWKFEVIATRSQDKGLRIISEEPERNVVYPWRVSINSDEVFQCNVTNALVTGVVAAKRAWDWITRDADGAQLVEYSAYRIRNLTGLKLLYWCPSCSINSLAPGGEEALSFAGWSEKKSVSRLDDDIRAPITKHLGRSLHIAVENDDSYDVEGGMKRQWRSEFAIPVDQADSRMYALVDPEGDAFGSRAKKCECVIDVLVERGCKVFVVRSTVMIENSTGSDLEIEFVPPMRRAASPAFRTSSPRGHMFPSWKNVVHSSSVTPLPLNIVASVDGYLMVRPPDIRSSDSGGSSLPKAYAKKRVHLPLFERASAALGDGISPESPTVESVAQTSIKFHRLYGDRPVRPFMMSAVLSTTKAALYQRKLSFHPPLVIHNLMAGPVEFCLATPSDWTPASDIASSASTSINLGWEDCEQRLRERGTIGIADCLTWHLCDWGTPLELRIRIKGFEWSDPLRIVEDMDEMNRIRMADLSSTAHLFVTAEVQLVEGKCRALYLYVPYWIVNLTGLKLEYEHDDERAAYEHPTMLLAGQKALNRDELLLREECARNSRHAIHSHVLRPTKQNSKKHSDQANEQVSTSGLPTDESTRRHPGLIPSIPPIKGLLDLLPKGTDDPRALGQLEVLQACHSSSHPGRGAIRIRVNEVEQRNGPPSDSLQQKWTEAVVLDQAGTSGELEAADYSIDRLYAIGFAITNAKGRYSRTKVIMLTPRFVVINTLDTAIEVSHSSARLVPGIDDQGRGMLSALNPALHLEAGGYADFHWSMQYARSKTIRCRLAEFGWSWSGAVPLGESGEFVVRIRNDSTRAIKMIRIVLKLDRPCVCVYIREEHSGAPPYRIENYSLETFRVHQHRVRRSEILLPHHSLDYAWDEPTQTRILVVDMLPSAAGDNSRPLRIGSFSLDKIQHFPDSLGGTLGIEISADGPTRVLRFTDTRLRAARTWTADGVDGSDEVNSTVSSQISFPHQFLRLPSLELSVQLQGFGLSVVDAGPRELIYVSVTGISLDVFVSNHGDAIGGTGGASMSRLTREDDLRVVACRFYLQDFQIDNQLPVTPYPVLLRFSNSTARTRVVDGQTHTVPVVDIRLVKHDGYAGINFIRHFSTSFLPVHIRVDGSLLYKLLPMLIHVKEGTRSDNAALTSGMRSGHRFNQSSAWLHEYNESLSVGVEVLEVIREDGTTSLAASHRSSSDSSPTRSRYDLLRRPSMNSISQGNHGKLVSKAEATKLYFEEFHIDPIRATVSFSFGASAGAMVEGLHAFSDSTHVSGTTVGPLRLILNAIGTSLTKIANAPFHLKAIHINHSFIQPDAVASRLAAHYQSEGLRQAYVILGSVDVFGNPMIAWRNMKSGFHDFISEPAHGISKSPREFAMGMGRGTYSLMRASVYTILDFNARILTASSLGLSEACLKLDEYTGYPATRNIYQGFAQGISGIVVSPIRAVEFNGVRGIVPGLLAGVFGLVMKPLLGLSLATATTLGTLRDAIDPNTKALLMRVRPPRHIDMRTRRLKVYSYVEALGEELVGKIRGGRYRGDGYLGHVDLRQKCLIVTRKRVMLVDVKASHRFEVDWELTSNEIVLVEWHPSAEGGGLNLFYIEEDYTPRRRAAIAAKGMFLSKHSVSLPDGKILFVRAMLQQQDRWRYAPESDEDGTKMNAGVEANTDRQMMSQQLRLEGFKTEYPIFRIALPPSRTLSNLHQAALHPTTPLHLVGDDLNPFNAGSRESVDPTNLSTDSDHQVREQNDPDEANQHVDELILAEDGIDHIDNEHF